MRLDSSPLIKVSSHIISESVFVRVVACWMRVILGDEIFDGVSLEIG